MQHHRRADYSLGFNPLTYADPTGEAVVRRLDGDVLISWPDGFTIRLNQSDSGPLVRILTGLYSFKQSRRGHIWGTKRKTPTVQVGVTSETNAHEGNKDVC
jgi:hypothetical protein